MSNVQENDREYYNKHLNCYLCFSVPLCFKEMKHCRYGCIPIPCSPGTVVILNLVCIIPVLI